MVPLLNSLSSFITKIAPIKFKFKSMFPVEMGCVGFYFQQGFAGTIYCVNVTHSKCNVWSIARGEMIWDPGD